MSEYKVGDIVKLSTGEKGIVKDVKYKCEIENDDTYNLYEKEIIGLWEECNSVNSSVKKYKLIEPNHSPDIGKMAEPTDNTKIEELDKEEMLCLTLQCAIAVLTDKLNEVIRKLNKENNNE
jgi:hypothetical protein